MAWTCWDDDLLDCLPLVIKENSDIPEPEIKCQTDKCVWTATFKDQIQFDRHFRYHVQLLAKYSESLDVAIDKYGFHDNRTILLAKAAFIQVRQYLEIDFIFQMFIQSINSNTVLSFLLSKIDYTG
jgi:hypothetical protein